MSLTLAPLFADRAVLQVELPLRVWGTATPGAMVTVTIAGYRRSARTAGDGSWLAELPPLPEGWSGQLKVVGAGEEIIRRGCVGGEVWLCSGQSNMEWQLNQLAGGTVLREAAAVDGIRYFRAANEWGPTPQQTCNGAWRVAHGPTAGDCSAVGFTFASALRRRLERPVGLVVNAIGGSLIESWLPSEQGLLLPGGAERAAQIQACHRALGPAVDEWIVRLQAWRRALGEDIPVGAALPRLPPVSLPPDLFGAGDNWQAANQLGACYNALVAPLAPASLRGVLWYQGESNADQAEYYAAFYRQMVASWRTAFRDPGLPFYSVQLAGYHSEWEREHLAPDQPRLDGGWPALRAAQDTTTDLPHSGLVTAIDVGDRYNIHPENKVAVGERLAAMALHRSYGRRIHDEGPRLAAATYQRGKVTVTTAAGGRLQLTNGRQVLGFHLRSGRRWAAAVGRLVDDSVVLDAPRGANEVAYAWRGYQDLNLVDGQGWPAFPVRLPVT